MEDYTLHPVSESQAGPSLGMVTTGTLHSLGEAPATMCMLADALNL